MRNRKHEIRCLHCGVVVFFTELELICYGPDTEMFLRSTGEHLCDDGFNGIFVYQGYRETDNPDKQ